MRTGQEAVASARALVGVRFRPQGRQADYGFDCVGLAAAAYDIMVPADYALRFGEAARLTRLIRDAGFREVAVAEAGDLLMIQAGPAQLHLAVRTEVGFVQAHAGLRRVVETPGWPTEPVLAVYRPEAG